MTFKNRLRDDFQTQNTKPHPHKDPGCQHRVIKELRRLIEIGPDSIKMDKVCHHIHGIWKKQ